MGTMSGDDDHGLECAHCEPSDGLHVVGVADLARCDREILSNLVD